MRSDRRSKGTGIRVLSCLPAIVRPIYDLSGIWKPLPCLGLFSGCTSLALLDLRAADLDPAVAELSAFYSGTSSLLNVPQISTIPAHSYPRRQIKGTESDRHRVQRHVRGECRRCDGQGGGRAGADRRRSRVGRCVSPGSPLMNATMTGILQESWRITLLSSASFLYAVPEAFDR